VITLKWKKGTRALSADFGAGGTVRLVPCTNSVRNAALKTRSLENPEDVVFTTPLAGNGHFPYQPSGFPPGRWKITQVRLRSDPYTAPYFVSTDAWQDTEAWTLDPDGSYGKPSGIMVKDGCFGLHSSVSPTTLGCVRITSRIDLEMLAKKLIEVADKVDDKTWAVRDGQGWFVVEA
jgi:hypothetical protein